MRTDVLGVIMLGLSRRGSPRAHCVRPPAEPRRASTRRRAVPATGRRAVGRTGPAGPPDGHRDPLAGVMRRGGRYDWSSGVERPVGNGRLLPRELGVDAPIVSTCPGGKHARRRAGERTASRHPGVVGTRRRGARGRRHGGTDEGGRAVSASSGAAAPRAVNSQVDGMSGPPFVVVAAAGAAVVDEDWHRVRVLYSKQRGAAKSFQSSGS